MMPPDTTLAYAKPQTRTAGAGHYRILVGLSWSLFVIEAAFHSVLVARAYAATNTYVWERFERNVGPRWLFIDVQEGLFFFGAVLSFAALFQPTPKRWHAGLALGLHVAMLLLLEFPYTFTIP